MGLEDRELYTVIVRTVQPEGLEDDGIVKALAASTIDLVAEATVCFC